MKVTPNGRRITRDERTIVKYGRDFNSNTLVACWYHGGLRCHDEPAWAMEADIFDSISVSVDRILVANYEDGVYSLPADRLGECREMIDGSEQVVVSADMEYVSKVTDEPNTVLRGALWSEHDA